MVGAKGAVRTKGVDALGEWSGENGGPIELEESRGELGNEGDVRGRADAGERRGRSCRCGTEMGATTLAMGW